MQRKRRKGRNRLGINDRRVEGGSDESTAHLANVSGRSSRGNRRCSECRYPVMDLERRTDRSGDTRNVFIIENKIYMLPARQIR